MSVPVTFAPFALQPDQGRVHLTLAEGLTLAEIVAGALPGALETVLDRVTVTLVSDQGSARIRRAIWHRVRPFAGTHVIIMVAPGRQALSLLIAVAAIAVSTFFFPAGAAGLFGLGLQATRSIVTLGLTGLGGLLLNALVPPPKAERAEKPTYAISGWQNELRPDQPFPIVFGRIRYAPPLAAHSYIEVVGNLLYHRMAVVWGLGKHEISDLKNGDKSLDKYDEITVETRLGHDDDEPLTLYTQQVIEEKVGTDLRREFQRDDAGNPLPGGWLAPVDEKPVEVTTAREVTHAFAIISYPAGLGYINSKNKKMYVSCRFGLRVKPAGSEVWEVRPDILIREKKFAGIFRAIRIDFPVRGTYTYELNRKSVSEQPEDDVGTYVMTSTWAVQQSFRPEYPFNFDRPMALTALRAKATFQLNGGLDALNGIVWRVAPDWDAATETWIERATRNAASAGLYALRGPGLYRPYTDDQIDLDAFADWHVFCVLKGLTYDRVHDFDGASFEETLLAIGAAGRAAIIHDGRRWTVIIDRPRDLVVDVITPRNSSDFQAYPQYFKPPHAFRVQFLDETNDYQPAERIIPWPGHVGPVDTTEALDLPGITNPDRIWIEARRRQYERMNRSVTYSVVQPGAARTATRGDLVMLSRDVLRRAMHSARVIAVRDNLIEIDAIWRMAAGSSYAILFQRFDEDDTVGQGIVRTIATVDGEVSAVRLTGTGVAPAVGDVLAFGPAGEVTIPVIITSIERGKDNSSVLTMMPAADIIDELTDAEVPPAWSGRVGAEIEFSSEPPAAPRMVDIVTGTEETGSAGGLWVYLEPGLSPVIVATYAVEHRLVGAPAWSAPVLCTAFEALAKIPGYAPDDQVQLRAFAASISAVNSPYGTVVTVTIGDPVVPPLPAMGAEYPVIF